MVNEKNIINEIEKMIKNFEIYKKIVDSYKDKENNKFIEGYIKRIEAIIDDLYFSMLQFEVIIDDLYFLIYDK